MWPEAGHCARARPDPGRVTSRRFRDLRLFGLQFTSPITLVLIAATALSMLLGEVVDGAIILTIVVAS